MPLKPPPWRPRGRRRHQLAGRPPGYRGRLRGFGGRSRRAHQLYRTRGRTAQVGGRLADPARQRQEHRRLDRDERRPRRPARCDPRRHRAVGWRAFEGEPDRQHDGLVAAPGRARDGRGQRVVPDRARQQLEQLHPHERLLATEDALADGAHRAHGQLAGGDQEGGARVRERVGPAGEPQPHLAAGTDAPLRLEPHRRLLRRVCAASAEAHRPRADGIGRSEAVDPDEGGHPQGRAASGRRVRHRRAAPMPTLRSNHGSAGRARAEARMHAPRAGRSRGTAPRRGVYDSNACAPPSRPS
jgi:hypothetical protein